MELATVGMQLLFIKNTMLTGTPTTVMRTYYMYIMQYVTKYYMLCEGKQFLLF